MFWQHVIRWLLLPVLTFALGVAATTLWTRHSASKPKTVAVSTPTESPILGLCELLDNQDKYSGQTVRVSATMSGFIHGMFLYNPNCVTVNSQTAVFFNPGNKEQIRETLKQARGSDDWREAVDIIALGQFRKVTPSNRSDTIYDTAPLQFEIMRVEKASKVR